MKCCGWGWWIAPKIESFLIYGFTRIMSWLIFVVLSLECEQLLLSSRMEVIFFFTNFSWHNHWNRYCLLLSQWESGIYPSVAGFAVVFIFLGMVGWFHNRTQIVPLLLETLGFSIMALIMFKLNSYHWNSNSPAT